MQDFWKINRGKLLLFLILVVAAFFRFYGLNWDQNQHLHPDERFLTMVGNAIQIPKSISSYLDPNVSTFNPANINYKFFVYGTFPLTLNKISAVILRNDTYNNFTIQGRFLSALVDLLVVLLVYKTAELFEKKYNLDSSIKYWASFFYAIAVLPIQLSHFFAVDTFLNFFMFASFYFALRFWLKKTISNLSLSALLLGLAIASKITALFIFPLILVFIVATFHEKGLLLTRLKRTVSYVLLSALIVYVTVRIADPYLFQSANMLNPQISEVFINNLKTLKSFEGRDVLYPPAVQWVNKPQIIFSLIDIAFFGVGLAYFLFIVSGIYAFLKKIRVVSLLVIVSWVVLFFLYQGSQFAQTMRYFIFLYPFFAIFAAFGLQQILGLVKKYFSNWYLLIVLAPIIIGVGSILSWPLAFISIYTKGHSRVAASEWIYRNLEDGSIILSEHWDDSLPLNVTNIYGKQFIVEQLPVFDLDTSEKWQKMNELLQKADYYVLSSNRAWGSIPTVPEKYPRMSRFYEDLLADKLSYKKIKEFTSYPSFRYLGLPIDFPDDWAEESFTVYDHPKVVIFKKI